MKAKQLLALLPVLLDAIAHAAAPQQRIRFNSLDDQPGITDTAVYGFEQDPTGFLWIGTNKGLYRFDGYHTRRFRTDRDNPQSLSSNDISDLLVDEKGRLWIGTWSGGLNLYDEATDSFRRFRESSGSSGPIEAVRSLASAADGGLWIGTWGQGLHRLSPADDSIATIGGDPSRDLATGLLKIAGIATDANGRVWMAAWDRGLLLYDPANGSWRQWLADADGVTAAQYGRISAIHRRGSTIWIGSDVGGIVCFDVRTLSPSCEIPFAPGYKEQVRSIYLDESAHLWVATLGGGLTRIDTASGERAVYTYRPASTTSINSNDIVTLFEDRSGVLWLGTLGAGANYFEINGQDIAHFQSDPLAASTLRSNDVRALAETSDGRIWIGTDGGGLHHFDPLTEQITPFDVSDSYYDERVWSLQAAPGGMLWIGTWGGGLYLLDLQRNRVQKHLSRSDGLADNVVTLLKLDSKQRLWIGTESGGISRYDSRSDQLESFRSDPADPASIASDLATSFYEDRAGNLWVGLYGAGINRYAGEQQFERLPAGAAGTGLEIEDVISMVERADGRFWLGTGNGLGLFDPDSKQFERKLAIDSPSGSRVIDLVLDSAGDLWISSDNGLYRYTESSGLTEHLTRQDGLQSLSFSHGAALAASDGTLYFGGPNGFNRFDPARITSNEFAPTIVVTDIRVLQEAVANPLDAASGRNATPFQLQALQLRHDQNHVSFEFSALHYVSPADNQYAYQLAGFDTDWNYTPATNRIANYTNLPPGDYELRIKAANSDGVWTKSERRLALSILPPWWMTNWALAAYVIGFALLVTTLIRVRTHRLKVYAAQLRAEVRLKTQTVVEQNRTIEAQAADLRQALDSRNEFFARISHEFRTPLTLILGPARLLKNRLSAVNDLAQLDLIERNTRRVLRLVEQLLGIAKSGKLPAGKALTINVAPVIASICASFESAVTDKGLELTSKIDEIIPVTCDPPGFEQVFLNLVSNAIKYTKAGGTIRVSATTQGDQVVIAISDSGIGISPAELQRIFEPFYRTEAVSAGNESGTGLGLTVARDCVRHDHGDIAIESTPGAGTTVTVTYPAADTTKLTPHEPALQAVGLEVAATLADAGAEPVAQTATAIDNASHILIVDDNDEMRRHLSMILAPHYNCQTAADGDEALAHVQEFLPDLVISDVSMPGKDGFELTQALKTDDRSCHIPVILLTARADDESRHRGYAEHADIYMTKPFDAEELLLRVSNLFGLLAIRRHGMTTRLFEDAIAGGIAASADCSARDKRFLEKLQRFLEANYAQSGIATADIADALAMSERQLQRKLKALLNHSPAELLRLFRLEKSRSRLREGERPADVALDVGFSSQAHFGACFKARYGVSPGQYASEGKR